MSAATHAACQLRGPLRCNQGGSVCPKDTHARDAAARPANPRALAVLSPQRRLRCTCSALRCRRRYIARGACVYQGIAPDTCFDSMWVLIALFGGLQLVLAQLPSECPSLMSCAAPFPHARACRIPLTRPPLRPLGTSPGCPLASACPARGPQHA